MKKLLNLTAIASLLLTAGTARAGEPVIQEKTVAPPEEEHYQASRGLITLQGPSGMFNNPTSATLPQGKFTMQYCLFFPNRDTDVVGHGTLIAVGVTDWLELGFVGNLIDVNAGVTKEFVVGGPMARVRLLRDQEWWPEISVGGYVKWGTNVLNSSTAFIAASKRVPIDPDGFFKSVVIQTGFRHTWFDQPQGRFRTEDSRRAYGGLELELPYRFYVIGEWTQKDNDIDRRTPISYGLQCRLPGVALTCALLQDGGQHERIGIYSGIGISFGF